MLRGGPRSLFFQDRSVVLLGSVGYGIPLTSLPPSMVTSLLVSILAFAGCKHLPWAILRWQRTPLAPYSRFLLSLVRCHWTTPGLYMSRRHPHSTANGLSSTSRKNPGHHFALSPQHSTYRWGVDLITQTPLLWQLHRTVSAWLQRDWMSRGQVGQSKGAHSLWSSQFCSHWKNPQSQRHHCRGRTHT